MRYKIHDYSMCFINISPIHRYGLLINLLYDRKIAISAAIKLLYGVHKLLMTHENTHERRLCVVVVGAPLDHVEYGDKER